MDFRQHNVSLYQTPSLRCLVFGIISNMEGYYTTYKENVLLGKWTIERLGSILHESSKINNASLRVDFLSKYFLETPYKESTLIGDIHTSEVFVINLEGVDCFTFIEYIESMRLSSSFHEFKNNLKRVRYRNGKISFENRNHFFIDWNEFNSNLIDNVTEQIGKNKTIGIRKMLNVKDDGTYFLPGIQPRERLINYLPSNVIENSIINELRIGDYIGIYSEKQGLDVSHIGIFIREGDNIYLRHASSLQEHRKVIDEDFRNYILNKPGIIVFRSRK